MVVGGYLVVVSGWVVAKCLPFFLISCMREPGNHTPGQIVSHVVEMESLQCVKLEWNPMYLGETN